MSREFYMEIDEGVRDTVRLLRNMGVNTICSCHHEGYIQCLSTDPYTEQQNIMTVMTQLGIKDYKAVLTIEHRPDFWHSFWEITSPSFIKEG